MCVCPSVQVDVIIDETYAPDPTTYHLTAFLNTYNLTMADVAEYKWGGSNPKVAPEPDLNEIDSVHSPAARLLVGLSRKYAKEAEVVGMVHCCKLPILSLERQQLTALPANIVHTTV